GDRRGARRRGSRRARAAGSLRGRARPPKGSQAGPPHARPAAANAVGQAAAAGASMSFDPNSHREASLRNWEEAASGWARRQEMLRELGAPVSHWMLDAVSPQPGQRVLELAAGLGETGMLA